MIVEAPPHIPSGIAGQPAGDLSGKPAGGTCPPHQRTEPVGDHVLRDKVRIRCAPGPGTSHP